MTKDIYVIVAPSGYWEDFFWTKEAADRTLQVDFDRKGMRGYSVEKWTAQKEAD